MPAIFRYQWREGNGRETLRALNKTGVLLPLAWVRENETSGMVLHSEGKAFL